MKKIFVFLPKYSLIKLLFNTKKQKFSYYDET